MNLQVLPTYEIQITLINNNIYHILPPKKYMSSTPPMVMDFILLFP